MKPDLRDPLAQPRDLGDAFEVLPVRVAVDVEIRLEDFELFLGESGPDPFGLLLRTLAAASFSSVL